MKKLIKLFNCLLVIVSVFLISSCNKNDKFDFNDDYFVGIQEHIYEVRPMESTFTIDYVCDMVKAMGSKVFRLNYTMYNLFYVDSNDTVKFNESSKETLRRVVDGLKAAGVERILYCTDTYIYPNGYKETHNKSVPDPYSERSAYLRFLKVNSIGYGMIAQEFPEINYFEQINEPDIPNNECVCRNGMIWGTSDSQFMYSVEDEANIVVDMLYYCNKEIKKANSNNKMLTNGFSSLSSCLDYIECMYQAIESGAHPTGDDLPCSVDPDDYFDIFNIHPYSNVCTVANPESPKENGITLITEDYAKSCDMFYQVCCDHGDGEKPHWYTEIGYTDSGDATKQEIIARETTKQLQMIKDELPYVECVIFYVLGNLKETNVSITENNFGLFTNPADPEHPMEPKPIFKAIYKFMHGSEDLSVFDEIRQKYCK